MPLKAILKPHKKNLIIKFIVVGGPKNRFFLQRVGPGFWVKNHQNFEVGIFIGARPCRKTPLGIIFKCK